MLLSAHDSHTKNTDTEQIVIEIGTIKLSKNVHADTKTGNKCIVGYIEAHYKAKKFRTREMKLYEGSTFGIPFNALLTGLSLHLCIQDKDEETTTIIGVGTMDFSYIKSTKLSAPLESYTKITSGTDKIGKITYCIRKVSIFADGTTNELHDSRSDVDRIEELNVLYPLPSFQFHRLCRPVHWERLKGLNLDRVIRGVDITTLMSCVEDVAHGDVSQEDVDHKLLKTLQLSQYSVQYLLSCQKEMRNNKDVIKSALKVFHDEEALVDIKLAKLRSRLKALKRENTTLDTLHSEYEDLLLNIDPKLSKAYKKSLYIDSHREEFKVT
jgi:hypothetical protein